MTEITERQKAVLDFIKSYRKMNGICPSRLEIATEMGFNANAAQCHIKALENKGYIKCLPRIARGIKILRRKI